MDAKDKYKGYRIVKHKDREVYKIQKKWLFWWISLVEKDDWGVVPGSLFIVIERLSYQAAKRTLDEIIDRKNKKNNKSDKRKWNVVNIDD